MQVPTTFSLKSMKPSHRLLSTSPPLFVIKRRPYPHPRSKPLTCIWKSGLIPGTFWGSTTGGSHDRSRSKFPRESRACRVLLQTYHRPFVRRRSRRGLQRVFYKNHLCKAPRIGCSQEMVQRLYPRPSPAHRRPLDLRRGRVDGRIPQVDRHSKQVVIRVRDEIKDFPL